ncbi:MAG: hypothetical protein GX442_04225 [Candidatus Riflebacteria bacterium]|nr:hypothetical protein [Candidatus Riflebacteria bacterium]
MGIRHPSVLLCCLGLALLAGVLALLGCGGGGSGGSGATSGVFEGVLVPVKMSQEGSSDMDGLFATVKGDKVSGGWIENQQGTKLMGSDLLLNSVTGKYEVLLTKNPDTFPAGTYVLKYMVNGETREYKPNPLSWTPLTRFQSVTKDWDPVTRYLRVQFNALVGASVRYYLRMYNPNSGLLRKETFETTATEIREFVPDSGTMQVMLVADILEGNAVVGKVLHFFQESTF